MPRNARFDCPEFPIRFPRDCIYRYESNIDAFAQTRANFSRQGLVTPGPVLTSGHEEHVNGIGIFLPDLSLYQASLILEDMI
jgi:hypothetical protein